ncbi:MAG: leucyl aminopeptidase [Sphingomonas sp.]
MQIQFAARNADAAVLVLPVEKDGLARLSFGDIAEGDSRTVLGAARETRFEGEAGSIVEAFLPAGDSVRRVLLLGVGAGSEADYERAGGSLVAKFLTSGVTDLTVDFAALGGAPAAKLVARFAAGAAQRAWRHDAYRTRLTDRQKPTLVTVTIAGAPDGTNAAWGEFDALTQGMALARELVTEPANIIYPESFVERVRGAVDGLGLEITVLDEDEMRKLGMGALLGVNQGSVRAPRLLALKWSGAGEGDPDVAFVGKGVTFDTGGISIKPAAGMEDMKWDMGGAAAVVGAMQAIALRKAKANVIGVCGLVENMPDGNAQRPGDVVTSMSGQTIEVINTDAEGRLVLADALCWVQRTHRPKTIVDLATLTGAMIIALGHEHGGLFSNDDSLADQLLAAGTSSGDKLWRLPIGPAYDKLLDSPIADMKNVGPRAAGSITAAQFLQRFIDSGVRWAHLDIAGMVWADKPGANYDKGATGFGVRVLDRFVKDACER